MIVRVTVLPGHRSRRGRGIEINVWGLVYGRADGSGGCRASGDTIDLPVERLVEIANSIAGELHCGVEGNVRGGGREADGDGWRRNDKG